jgi:hypothetical protein
MARFTGAGGGEAGVAGPQGPAGPQGETGPAGADGNPLDFLAVPSNIVPDTDATYSLGTAEKKWTSIHVGPDSLYIEDSTTGADVEITVDDGVFFIDGIAQAQLPNLAVTNLTFSDDTVQTTAAVNSDWDATTGLAQILNKPDLSSLVPTETSFVVNGGTLGTQPTFNGDPLFTGHYVKTGPLVYVDIEVDFSNITNFGGGQYFLDIPFPTKRDISFDGVLHDVSANDYYQITGVCEAGESRVLLHYGAGSGKLEPFEEGHPRHLQTADHFALHGSYIDGTV